MALASSHNRRPGPSRAFPPPHGPIHLLPLLPALIRRMAEDAKHAQNGAGAGLPGRLGGGSGGSGVGPIQLPIQQEAVGAGERSRRLFYSEPRSSVLFHRPG